MATGDRFDLSPEYLREQDWLDRRDAKSYALDAYPLVDQVGSRVILIWEVNGVRYGVMDGIVTRSNDELVLVVKDLSDGSMHRFDPLSDFEWYQNRYFMKSSWWRRLKYVTPAARRLRNRT